MSGVHLFSFANIWVQLAFFLLLVFYFEMIWKCIQNKFQIDCVLINWVGYVDIDMSKIDPNWKPDPNPPESFGFWTRFSRPEPEINRTRKTRKLTGQTRPDPNPPAWPEHYIHSSLFFSNLSLLTIMVSHFY